MNNFRNGAFTVLCQFPRTKFCAARKVSPNWLQETMTCHSSHCFSIVCLGWCVICHQTELGRTESQTFRKKYKIQSPAPELSQGWLITTHHPNQTILKLHILAQWANQKARTFASSNRKKRQWSGNPLHINDLTERSSAFKRLLLQ